MKAGITLAIRAREIVSATRSMVHRRSDLYRTNLLGRMKFT
jgi:hypothetical protein